MKNLFVSINEVSYMTDYFFLCQDPTMTQSRCKKEFRAFPVLVDTMCGINGHINITLIVKDQALGIQVLDHLFCRKVFNTQPIFLFNRADHKIPNF